MLAGFLIYIAVRFEWKFAVTASIVAMFDLIVTVAYVSLLGREFDLTVLAGLLSVMGFAINDIIVVFDRVRENFRSLRVDSMEVLNRSINQTLSRTVITAVMFFLSALALYLYGGASMEGLAETHMIGAVIVVLSSILVAVPMLTIGFLRVSKQDLLPRRRTSRPWPVARKHLLHAAHREPARAGFVQGFRQTPPYASVGCAIVPAHYDPAVAPVFLLSAPCAASANPRYPWSSNRASAASSASPPTRPAARPRSSSRSTTSARVRRSRTARSGCW